MGDPNQVDAQLPGLFLELAVHAVQRLAAHVLPENDHVRVEFFAELPQLIQQHLVAAVGPVAHDHVLRQPGHIVNSLLPVLGGVFFCQHLGGDHAQHVCQRHDAPAIQQPQQEIHVVVGLHAPDNGPVAVFFGHALLFGVGLFCKPGNRPVRLHKFRHLAADGHIVGLCVQSQIGAEDLGVVRLVHIQPFLTVLGGDIHPLGALEVILPVPLLPGVLFYEGNGVADFLGGVFLYVLLSVPQGGGQLEAGNAVLQLQTFGDDAVAHEGAVAGGVALDGAGA